MRQPLHRHFYLILLLLTATSCNTITSSVATPSVPTGNVVPDFVNFIPETTLGSGQTAALTGPATQWTTDFLQGAINEARLQRTSLESYGALLTAALTAASITTITSTAQTVNLSSINLINTTAPWEVELLQDTHDTDFIRMYFKNSTTGKIQGTYLVISDTNGNPIQGLFAYVNPNLLVSTDGPGTRLVALAFDFSDPTQNLITMRVYQYNSTLQRNFAYHIHYQCNTVTTKCLGEYLNIQTAEPTRTLASDLIRFSWNEDNQEVCVANLTYENNSAIVGATQKFTGPTQPTDSGVTTGTCSLDTPHWGTHAYRTTDLPQRYNDTSPVGGTAADYFVDGSSKDGWDALTPALIDTWLDASDF